MVIESYQLPYVSKNLKWNHFFFYKTILQYVYLYTKYKKKVFYQKISRFKKRNSTYSFLVSNIMFILTYYGS